MPNLLAACVKIELLKTDAARFEQNVKAQTSPVQGKRCLNTFVTFALGLFFRCNTAILEKKNETHHPSNES